MNITKKRLETLQLLNENPHGLYVGAIANTVLCSDYRKKNCGGLWPQAATRMGAGYVKPMMKAGLVSVKYTDVGWGVAFITQAGKDVLKKHQEDSLDAVIARCVED